MLATFKPTGFASRIFGIALALLIGSSALAPVVGAQPAYADALVQEQAGFGRFDPSVRLYYAALDSQDREEYRNLLEGILSYESSIELIRPCEVSDLKRIVESILGDQLDIFWISDYEYDVLNGLVISVQFPSVYGGRDLDAMRAELQDATDSIVSQVSGLESYQLEKAVFDAVAARVAYAGDGADLGQGSYAALVEGEAVCAGYSRAYQHLMLALGVPCTYVGGLGKGEDPNPEWSSEGEIVGEEGPSDKPGWGPHAWNMVKQDGSWYNLDVTWADTEIFERESVAYTHYNATDGEFAADHERDPICEALPACSSSFDFAATYGEEPPVVTLQDAGFQVDAVVDSPEFFVESSVDQSDELAGGSMEYIAVVYGMGDAQIEQVREDALQALAKSVPGNGELLVTRHWYRYMPGVILEKDDYTYSRA